MLPLRLGQGRGGSNPEGNSATTHTPFSNRSCLRWTETPIATLHSGPRIAVPGIHPKPIRPICGGGAVYTRPIDDSKISWHRLNQRPRMVLADRSPS